MTVIVVLAMIFALLALRLFSVLGRRTGHEQQRQLPTPADDRPAVIGRPRDAQTDTPADAQRASESAVSTPAQAGVRAIIAADRNFDVVQFLGGARAAYGIILESYWKGDRDTLKNLCEPHVYEAFEQAITTREAEGETLDNRLVRIEAANITDVRMEGGKAYVAVRFEADLSAVTRNRDGQVVAGSLDDAIATTETWTFARDLRNRDPNWQLADTDED